MSNQSPFFAIRCPAVNYGQTSPAWNAGKIISVTVHQDALVDGDQLYYDGEQKLWVTEQRGAHVDIIPSTGNNNAFVRYDPSTDQLLYKSIHYGMFGSTMEQEIAASTPPTIINITRLTYNFARTAVGVGYASDQITFTQRGVYKIGVSILFRQKQGSGGLVYFAFHKNNQLIPNTATDTIVHGNSASSPVYAEIIEELLNPTDTISIACFTEANHVIVAYSAPSPTTSIGISPSVIVTVQQLV